MATLKHPRFDLREKYRRIFEVSLILSLSFMIAAFKYFPHLDSKALLKEIPPEIISVTDVLQTRQELKHPSPPRPSILMVET